MMDSIIAGIISGILSSAIIAIALFGIKPKVIISNELCRDCKDGKFRIKIVNLSRSNLIDVKYTLHYCRRYSDGIGDFHEIQPSKSRLEFLEAYSSDESYSDYAVRISYNIDDRFELTNNDCIIFTFYAKHALSGTATFITKEYKASNVKCGHFETGRSTKIIVELCNKTFESCKQANNVDFCTFF